ncbi:helix-turn-helix domain-containing protein [Acidiphilium multivorum]|uniref:helix-turn-helix domain-containing protein n=1 Tax=Acidiphilium multivorum TaxID=62140 RepID=UPI001B8BD192|nr:helix-turn-helix transcriptional regulator [Acidiphilium multivorum]MBS3025026.1 helix-turn-helix transcriptional regulator [Acidiphilium multivorum]
MSLREILGRNVRRLRVERRLSQEELAHLAKMNRNYVGMIERKESAATVDIIERLAAALDVSPVDLISPDTNRR